MRLWYDEHAATWRQTAAHGPGTPSAEDSYMDSLETPQAPLLDRLCSSGELHEAMKQLTARQAFVIGCRYGFRNDGVPVTQEEIADLCGWSIATVKEHEHYAEQKLYKILTGKRRENTLPS